jgi:hypothetical protein
MCYSKELSLTSLIFGILTSMTLIFFGNKESYATNNTIGLFYFFVSLMQLVEYFLWIDIDCKNGYNKLGAIIGPILNHLQPVIMLAIASKYLIPKTLISNTILIPLNIAYLIYVYYKYTKYISNKDNLCVKTNKCNHLDWTWKKDFNYIFYFIISFINVANFYNNTNLMVSFVLSYLLLIVSIFKFQKNIGEFWCLMVTGIPFVNIIMQKLLNINN